MQMIFQVWSVNVFLGQIFPTSAGEFKPPTARAGLADKLFPARIQTFILGVRASRAGHTVWHNYGCVFGGFSHQQAGMPGFSCCLTVFAPRFLHFSEQFPPTSYRTDKCSCAFLFAFCLWPCWNLSRGKHYAFR